MEELLLEALKNSDKMIALHNGRERWMYWDSGYWYVRQKGLSRPLERTEELSVALKTLMES